MTAIQALRASIGASSVPYTESSASTGTSSNAMAGYTVFDRGWAIDNTAQITSVGVYSNVADSLVVKIGLEASAGAQYDIVVSQALSHAGGGWQDVTLSSPYDVPASGTYRAGAYSPNGINFQISDRSYKSGNITGSAQSGFSAEASGQTFPMRVTGTKPA
jgi:hypothetical protein